jgi:hypothetical protein
MLPLIKIDQALRARRRAVYSPECVEVEFSEVRTGLREMASCLRWKGLLIRRFRAGRKGGSACTARRRHSPHLGPRTFRGGRGKSLRGGPAGGLLPAHPRGHSRPHDCNMHLAGRVGRGGKRTGRVGGRRVQRERILRDGGRRTARQLELFVPRLMAPTYPG